MANQILLGRALDANGYIAPAAKATIYADGTSTLITVYSDVDGATPAANPRPEAGRPAKATPRSPAPSSPC